jgi:hypothetical protein
MRLKYALKMTKYALKYALKVWICTKIDKICTIKLLFYGQKKIIYALNNFLIGFNCLCTVFLN